MLSRLGAVGCDVGDVQASCAGFEEHQGIVAVAECSVDVEKSAAEDAVALRGPRSTGPWRPSPPRRHRTLWHRKAGGNKLVHHPLCCALSPAGCDVAPPPSVQIRGILVHIRGAAGELRWHRCT